MDHETLRFEPICRSLDMELWENLELQTKGFVRNRANHADCTRVSILYHILGHLSPTIINKADNNWQGYATVHCFLFLLPPSWWDGWLPPGSCQHTIRAVHNYKYDLSTLKLFDNYMIQYYIMIWYLYLIILWPSGQTWPALYSYFFLIMVIVVYVFAVGPIFSLGKLNWQTEYVNSFL